MKGLLEQLCDKKVEREAAGFRAGSPQFSPREAHEAMGKVEWVTKEIRGLEEAIDEGRALASRTDEMIKEMNGSKHRSRVRSLAVTKLEEAAMWLRKEIEG